MNSIKTVKKSDYVLESEAEAERLERQAQTPQLLVSEEFRNFSASPGQRILDAGCGTGVVSRYLAKKFAEVEIVGCDLSDLRVQAAKNKSSELKNVHFSSENLTHLSFHDAVFDHVVCRYVLEHLSPENVLKVLNELKRVLKPGGRVFILDIDGILNNLYPQSEVVSHGIGQILKSSAIDLYVGRKIPDYLHQVGFSKIEWSIDTIQCHGKVMEFEYQLMRERLSGAHAFFSAVLNGEEAARVFEEQYLENMQSPAAVLFYNKFVISALK